MPPAILPGHLPGVDEDGPQKAGVLGEIQFDLAIPAGGVGEGIDAAVLAPRRRGRRVREAARRRDCRRRAPSRARSASGKRALSRSNSAGRTGLGRGAGRAVIVVRRYGRPGQSMGAQARSGAARAAPGSSDDQLSGGSAPRRTGGRVAARAAGARRIDAAVLRRPAGRPGRSRDSTGIPLHRCPRVIQL